MVKTDLFKYPVKEDTSAWIKKIGEAKYYDEGGEIMVEMNVDNCPPDLATYNAVLQKILTADAKNANATEGDNKFCAMMDLIEEMDHRNGIKPNQESWNAVLSETIQSGSFRLGYAVIEGMKSAGFTAPADLVGATEAAEAKAVAAGQEFPAHLSKAAESLFDEVGEH